MSTSLQWDVEIEDLFLLSISDSPSSRELYDLINEVNTRIAAHGKPVDIIVSVNPECKLPRGLFSIFNYYERRQDHNTRLIVLITNNPTMHMIHNVLLRAERMTPYIVDSVEDARAYVEQYRGQLDNHEE